MVLIKENGSGVFGANSVIDAAYVTAYLTDRNRLTENTWSARTPAIQAAACIAGSAHIETNFRARFRGIKEFKDISAARAVLDVTGQPTDTETVVIGSITYTFNTAIGGANSVLIGASVSASIDNLVQAVAAVNTDLEGVTYGTGTVPNVEAAAQVFYDDTLLCVSLITGTAGNAVATTTTVALASWNFATLNGGSDVRRAQPGSFPRFDLRDSDCNRVVGMPEPLLQCASEYAVRSLAGALAPDPTLDALGGQIVRLAKGTGPLRKDTTYQPGTVGSGRIPSYPFADQLIAEYLKPVGVMR